MKQEIFKWKCSKCGKEITSLYESQLIQNKDQHERSCNDETIVK